jgi:superfamily II DNA or RNA helicase
MSLRGANQTAFLRVLALFALSGVLPVHARQDGIDLARCREVFGNLARQNARGLGYAKLDAEQREFVDHVWLPTLGMRALHRDKDELRTCSVKNKNCVVFGNFGEGMDVEIRWEAQVAGGEPKIEWQSDGRKILVIPRGFQWERLPENGSYLIRQFLAGHDVHPYNADKVARGARVALGEKPILRKQVQVDAEKAVTDAIDSGDSSFLFVAPTGVGKTEVMKATLRKRLSQSAAAILRDLSGGRLSSEPPPAKLHVVVLPDRGLRTQTISDIEALQKEMNFELLTWGDKDGYLTVDQLQEKLRTSTKPIVVVTTSDSFQLSVNKNTEVTGDEKFDQEQREFTEQTLRDNLSTLIFDEAHHAGAPGMRDLLPRLVDRKLGSRAFLYGTTATPAHQHVDLIRHVFHDRAFWAYLDSPDTYRKGESKVDRDIPQSIEQLGEAILRGESSNFSPSPLDAERFKDLTGHDLFKETRPRDAEDAKEGGLIGNRWVIDPRHYKNVTNRVLPYFMRHKRGFVTASGKDEAMKMANEMQQILDDYVLHPEKYREMPRFLAEMDKQTLEELRRDILETRQSGAREGRRATVAYLHSGLSDNEKDSIKRDFEAGKIQFLYTVRMLDEGINVSDMTLWLDLNKSSNPKQQLQRLGRILRLVRGKDWTRPHGKSEVEWVSFQEPRDIEMAQMLLDMYAISRGEPVSRSRRLPEKESEVQPLVTEDGDGPGDINWSETELRHRFNYLFFQEDGKGEKTAALDAKRIVDHLESGASINPFATEDLSTRVTYDKLVKRLDMSDARLGKKKFNMIIENYPAARDRIGDIQRRRQEARAKLKTGKGAAEVLIDFVERYHRYPESVSRKFGTSKTIERSADEKEMADKIASYIAHGDLDFLIRLTERSVLNERQLKELKVSERMEEILKDQARILDLAEQFMKSHDGQLPSPHAMGFEGMLAQALLKIEDPLTTIGDRPVAWELEGVHDAVRRKQAAEVAAVAKAREQELARKAHEQMDPALLKPAAPQLPPHEGPVAPEVLHSLIADVSKQAAELPAKDFAGRAAVDHALSKLRQYQSDLAALKEAEAEGYPDMIDLYRAAADQSAKDAFSIPNLRQILDGKPEGNVRHSRLSVSGHHLATSELSKFYGRVVINLNNRIRDQLGRPVQPEDLWSLKIIPVADTRKFKSKVILDIQSPKNSDLTAFDLFGREGRTLNQVSFLDGGKPQSDETNVQLLGAGDVPLVVKPTLSRRYRFDRDGSFKDKNAESSPEFNPESFVEAIEFGMMTDLLKRYEAP